MSYIGISEYVIGVIYDQEIWYYVGEVDFGRKSLRPNKQFSPALSDAKRYDAMEILRDELAKLPTGLTCKILEIQRCPKCYKEFTEYPALSREDNETEICPGCGIFEAIERASEVLGKINVDTKGRKNDKRR